MTSIVPGFEYDIFISYRHNDNRSGWVTDFVNALQEELAATIKEPLSIYFDKNPHDGLLETHHVDKSLEGKLRCLIFIPIISQTYCDTKSFAWQHEFCTFNKLSKEDQFGRDIKLSNGNIASRILPIKIHNIDAEDNGSIAFMRGSSIWVVPFDMTKLETHTEPKEILTGIRLEHLGAGQFSVSSQGTIIYLAGDDTFIGGFMWVDKNGKTEPIPFSKENYGTFKLSPDQSKIAAPVYGTTNDLWVHDISNSKKMRVTNTGRSDNPVWRDNNSIYVRIDSNVYLVSSTQMLVLCWS